MRTTIFAALAAVLVSAAARAEQVTDRRPFQAPQGRYVVPTASAGLWLVQRGSLQRTTELSPGVRLATKPLRRLELDGGYRFSLQRDGTSALLISNTLHALDLRAHYCHDNGPFTFTVGAGPIGYLVTSTVFAQGAAEPTRVGWRLGGIAALGLETFLGRVPFRLEAALATRAHRLDALFTSAVGLY